MFCVQEKTRPRLVRVTVMSRRGVRGTINVHFSGMDLHVKPLFQLLTVAFYQVNELLLGMHA